MDEEIKIDRTKPVIPYGCEQCPQNNSSSVPKKIQNKGYSYLIVFLITGFMGLQSVDLKFNKTDQWAFSTKEVPFTVVVPGLVLIAGIMGLDISAIALNLGNVLASSKRVD